MSVFGASAALMASIATSSLSPDLAPPPPDLRSPWLSAGLTVASPAALLGLGLVASLPTLYVMPLGLVAGHLYAEDYPGASAAAFGGYAAPIMVGSAVAVAYIAFGPKQAPDPLLFTPDLTFALPALIGAAAGFAGYTVWAAYGAYEATERRNRRLQGED